MEFLWLPLSYLSTLYLPYVIHCWQLFISLWKPLWIHYVRSICMQWPWNLFQSLPSRYNRAFGLFLSVICIVCSSTVCSSIVCSNILPLLANAVLWGLTQSFFSYRTVVAGLCFLKLNEKESAPKFPNKNDIFSGAAFQLKPFHINRLFILWNILEEQRGADGRKGTGNCILMRSETTG